MNAALQLDARGKPVELGRELGRGGEGAVFNVSGRPDTVAKIYLKPPTADTAAKLSAMAALSDDRLLRIAAWPTGTLHGPDGRITGFTMPKVGGHRPVFQLYVPKSRLQAFSKADWRFLIHAAANTARAFAAVHSAGLVIGDVNHGNLVVGEDATVRMIDCDSFQVSSGPRTWFCTVGVGTHQPPEMQGRDSYAGILRTPHYDNFGLAVIIFQLLCMGRHPFAGRFVDKGEPPTIEEAIAASRYAYSRDGARTRMAAPPGSLPIGALSSEIQDLFETAFAPGSVRVGRPAAERWVTALGKLGGDVRQCRAQASHYFRNGLGACPWCAIENASGVILFPAVFVPGAPGGAGMAALWQEVTRLAEPPPPEPWPPPPKAATAPSPEARLAAESGRGLRNAAWASLAAAVGVSAVVATPSARAILLPAIGVLEFLIFMNQEQAKEGPFQQGLAAAQRDWELLRSSWAASLAGPGFKEIRVGLEKLKAEHDGLGAERAKRLQLLHEHRRARQLDAHLDRFLLASARIPGVGATRVATLASYGIDTAGDIVGSKLQPIPGFGPSTIAKLLAWRHIQEQSFRFDPNQGVAPAEVNGVEKAIAEQRLRLEREVSAGLHRLKASSAASLTMRGALRGRLRELQARYAQAMADASAAPGHRKTNKRMLVVSAAAIAVAVMSALGGAAPPPASLPPPARPPPVASPAVRVPDPGALSTAGPMADRPRAGTGPAPPAESPQRAAEPGPAVPPARDGEWVTVRQAANVRAAANGTAPIVRSAPRGSLLKVYARTAGWLQVGQEEAWGWIFAGLVEPAR